MGAVPVDLGLAPDDEDAIEQALSRAERQSSNRLKDVRRLGQGWVGEEALAVALYSAMVGESFEDAVRIAANHDGDSDRTDSLAGQIWGAHAGLSVLPQDWLDDLDVLDVLTPLLGHLVWPQVDDQAG